MTSCEAEANQQGAEIKGGTFGRGETCSAGQAGQSILVGFLPELLGTLLGEVEVCVEIHGLLRVKPLPLWHPCSGFLPVLMVLHTPQWAHARGG